MSLISDHRKFSQPPQSSWISPRSGTCDPLGFCWRSKFTRFSNNETITVQPTFATAATSNNKGASCFNGFGRFQVSKVFFYWIAVGFDFYAGAGPVRIWNGRVETPTPLRFRFNVDIFDISDNSDSNTCSNPYALCILQQPKRCVTCSTYIKLYNNPDAECLFSSFMPCTRWIPRMRRCDKYWSGVLPLVSFPVNNSTLR